MDYLPQLVQTLSQFLEDLERHTVSFFHTKMAFSTLRIKREVFERCIWGLLCTLKAYQTCFLPVEFQNEFG